MVSCDFDLHEGLMFSNGWRGSSGGVYESLDASTGEVIGRTAIADASDVEAAGASAVRAQEQWASTSFKVRAVVMRKAADALEAMRAEAESMMVREQGATGLKAQQEVDKSIEELRSAAGLVEHPVGELLSHEDPRVLSMARRVPVGVVGVIAPWNAPLLLAMRSVAPALALGNAVLLKPDIKTALTGGQVIARIFEEAGLPEGLLHVLPGGPVTGEAVVRSRHTDVISFTGSSAAGAHVGGIAGGMLKRVVLELGGNNAFIVLDDADLDDTVIFAQRGSLLHQGQICMATGRHLVHESIADEYVARLTDYTRGLKVGDPRSPEVQIGPLINELQAQRVEGIVRDAVDAGAIITTGGERTGSFFAPTVLDRVSQTNPAFEMEIFGPVIPITRFSSDEEAVALANSSEYGLSAAIHTVDMARALAMSNRLKTGMVHINGQTINDASHVPMGGMGKSGNGGRYGGHWNLDEFTSWQWVTARSPSA